MLKKPISYIEPWLKSRLKKKKKNFHWEIIGNISNGLQPYLDVTNLDPHLAVVDQRLHLRIANSGVLKISETLHHLGGSPTMLH